MKLWISRLNFLQHNYHITTGICHLYRDKFLKGCWSAGFYPRRCAFMHYKRLSRWDPFVLRIVLCWSFSLVPPLCRGSHNNPLTYGISITIPLTGGTYLRILRRNIDNIRTVDSTGTKNITFKVICEIWTRTYHYLLDKSIHGGIFFISQIVDIYFSLWSKFEFYFLSKRISSNSIMFNKKRIQSIYKR